jgi:hypothetical protein
MFQNPIFQNSGKYLGMTIKNFCNSFGGLNRYLFFVKLEFDSNFTKKTILKRKIIGDKIEV